MTCARIETVRMVRRCRWHNFGESLSLQPGWHSPERPGRRPPPRLVAAPGGERSLRCRPRLQAEAEIATSRRVSRRVASGAHISVPRAGFIRGLSSGNARVPRQPCADGCRRIRHDCPSRRVITRVPYSAMSCSWVITSTVMPRSMLSRWKIPMTSMLVRVSRLPVGSSASRIEGRVMSARAIATRCC